MVKEFNKKDLKEINEGNKLVVLDFYADWCGPCKMLSPIIDQLAKEYSDVVFYKVNVDKNNELASSLDIHSIPTVYFYKNNQVVDSFVGYKPKVQIQVIIGKYKD